MKKFAVLTSVLALAACGGGSGGSGKNTNLTWTNDTVITQDMINKDRSAQSLELQKKLKTIEYVENNLGSILENGELHGNTANISRSATTNKIGLLTLAEINARYEQAIEYFNILKKVLSVKEGSDTSVTVKDIKIAYSLSSNTKYDDIVQEDIPFVDLNQKDDIVISVNVILNVQVTIKQECSENEELKQNVSEEIVQEISVITSNTVNENNGNENNHNIPVLDISSLTSLDASVDNTAKINSYVAERLGENVDALKAFESAWKIYNDENDNPSADELRQAFLLVDFDDFDTVSKNGEDLQSAIDKFKGYNLYSLLDKFFPITEDENYDFYIFKYKEDLSDILFTSSGDYLIKFNMEDGNIVSITEDFDEPTEMTLKRTGEKTFALQNKKYLYKTNTEEFIKDLHSMPDTFEILERYAFFASNDDFNIDTLKQEIISKLITEGQEGEIINKISNDLEFKKITVDKAETKVESIGNSVGLKYSDFGYLEKTFVFKNENKEIHENGYDVYAGGYFTRKVDMPDTDMVFNGKAVAAITKDNGEGVADTGMLAKTDSAKLTLHDGTETLKMDFSKGPDGHKWYDITAEKSEPDNFVPGSITVAYDNEAVNEKIPQEFRVTSEMMTQAQDNDKYFDAQYFGDNDNATEATGVVGIDFDDLSVWASFGGKKEQN